MVFVPLAVVCTFIKTVIAGANPFEGWPGDLNYEGTVTDAIKLQWMEGRIGIALFALGFNLMGAGVQLLAPRKDKPGTVWQPGYWQRRHLMYTSLLLFVLL